MADSYDFNELSGRTSLQTIYFKKETFLIQTTKGFSADWSSTEAEIQ
jgi:hypothetical protein